MIKWVAFHSRSRTPSALLIQPHPLEKRRRFPSKKITTSSWSTTATVEKICMQCASYNSSSPSNLTALTTYSNIKAIAKVVGTTLRGIRVMNNKNGVIFYGPIWKHFGFCNRITYHFPINNNFLKKSQRYVPLQNNVTICHLPRTSSFRALIIQCSRHLLQSQRREPHDQLISPI